MKNKFSSNNLRLSNNNSKKEEKNKIRYEFKYKNNINNNNAKENLKESKVIINSKESQIITDKKDKEDDYDFEIYSNPITKYNFLVKDNNDIFKYKTINVANSFKNRLKDIFSFNNNRLYQKRNNISPIEFSPKLNLSFESNIDNELILGNHFNKDNSHLRTIVRIFDKYHKHALLLNQKNYKVKYNLYYNYKNRINNYNYLKYKNISKFSKKENKKNLKKNYSTILESHTKISSSHFQEIDKKNKISDIKEKKDESKEVEYKNKNKFKFNLKRGIESSTLNNTESNSKNIINSIIKDGKDKKNEHKIKSDENNLINTQNNPISLIKKISLDKNDKQISNSNEDNKDIRNSVNFSRRFVYKFHPINNINRKTKSFLEENEKNNNNNNKSINESIQIQENVKKEKKINLENIENNKNIFTRFQRQFPNKEYKKIYTNPDSIINKEKSSFNNSEKVLNNSLLSQNKINEKIITNNDKNDCKPLNINKRKNNRFLIKNNKENDKSDIEQNKKEESSIQKNFGKTFIQSQRNISTSINSENVNNVLAKSNNDLSKINEQKNPSQSNIIKLNNKNFINNDSFIFKSDKTNKNKFIFKNYNYKAINSTNDNIKENNINNKEDIKSDRLRTKIKIIKRYRRDKNNADNKSQDISNLNKTNNKEGNPFKEKINYYQIKKINNRYGNHKYHEIKSTSCGKNNNLIQNHKNNNHICYKIENKGAPRMRASTSMNNIKLLEKEINSDKVDDNKKKNKKKS